MLVTLPNGLLESNGQELFDRVKIDELRGKQQNYLADEELIMNNIGHVVKILEDMIQGLYTEDGVEWKGDKKQLSWKLPSSDLEVILIKIRENTFGPKYFFELECPHCQKVNKQKLLLDELKIDKLSPEQLLAPKVVKLPKSELEVEFKVTKLQQLLDAIRITTKDKKRLMTSLTALVIERIGDKKDIKSEDIDNLPMSDLAFLNKQAEKIKINGEIDTDIDVTCSKCKKDFKDKLNPFVPTFFVLTEESQT